MINKWPNPDIASISDAFGKFELNNEGLPTDRWENSFLCTVELPYPMRLSWDLEVVIHRVTCNQTVRSSLMNCLDSIFKLYGSLKAVQEARMDLFGGCYCFRRARGLSAPSVHSWGAAIDIDPDHNGLGTKWEKNKGMMPMEVVQIFKDEGWAWGGDFKGRPDCMHFEAINRT